MNEKDKVKIIPKNFYKKLLYLILVSVNPI
jgi:hypothetical protein